MKKIIFLLAISLLQADIYDDIMKSTSKTTAYKLKDKGKVDVILYEFKLQSYNNFSCKSFIGSSLFDMTTLAEDNAYQKTKVQCSIKF